MTNRDHIRELIAEKRKWSHPLKSEDIAKGFRGWYSSKYLPHFDAPGTRQFITYRLADSVPVAQRGEWEELLKLEDDIEKLRRIEAFLDSGLGACHLRDERIAQLVQGNLWHHDGHKYRLLAWGIMPNHVHVLIELGNSPMGDILKSWKSYTAKEANRVLGTRGSFWAEDYFDRYIRNEEHFWRVTRYIENNPVKAKLVNAPEEWCWSSARFRKQESLLEAPQLVRPGAEMTCKDARRLVRMYGGIRSERGQLVPVHPESTKAGQAVPVPTCIP